MTTRVAGMGIALLLAAGCASPPPPARPNQGRAASAAQRVSREPFQGPLTLAAAIDRAVEYSGEIAVFRAAVAAAAQNCRAASDWADPELNAQYGQETQDQTRRRYAVQGGGADGGARSTTGGTSSDGDAYRVGLRFFPPNPWARSADISARTAEWRAAEADLAYARWTVALAVRRLFAEVKYLERSVKLTRSLADLHGEVLKSVRERATLGQNTAAELLTASRRYMTARSDLSKAESAQRRAAAALGALVNLPAETIVPADGEFTPPVPEPGALHPDQLEGRALQNRADLAALFWRAAAAKAVCRQSRAARIPWFRQLEASYGEGSETTVGSTLSAVDPLDADGLSQSTTTRIDDSQERQEWRVAAAINVPLFSWHNRAEDARRAEFELASVRETEAVKKVGREVRDAIRDIVATHGDWQRFEQEMAPLIQEMRETLAKMGDTSSLPPDQVAAIKAQIVDSEHTKLQAAFDYQMAFINLEGVLGVSLDERRSTK
jgi:outer membrane protein TolC